MPHVLTTAAVIRCVHSGTFLVTPSQHTLTVNGAPVLLLSDLLTATVPDCTNTNASAGQAPCVKITAVSTGASRLLSVGGSPVALDTAKGTSQAVPVLPVAWHVSSAGQNRLSTD
ncbi:hypothetical protein ABZV60_25385 [Streptomyces sp. NPDC004787]|uniref:hypothetical protein n=1 Tax=Streptomyces sp. NPDC004787 TaxID=3154291 RepID=UPI00339EBF14